MLTPEMVKWATEQRRFLADLQGSWSAKLVELSLEHNKHFYTAASGAVRGHWNYNVSLVVKGLAKQECIALSKAYKKVTVDFVNQAHRIGFELADYWMRENDGQPSLDYATAPQAQEIVLNGVWDRLTGHVLLGCNSAVDRIPLQQASTSACNTLLRCFVDVCKKHQWRSERIIRTELSASLHTGVLERLVLCPTARKVLVDVANVELEDTNVLAQFHHGGGNYWAPPSHPNSTAVMVGYLPVT